MKILIVDDEPLILEGLERLLYQVGDATWEVSIATSGRAALASLVAMPADVVISDMRMPEMSGPALLEEVHTRWPETIRIILSGEADEASSLRAVPHAHQFIAKPCTPAVLWEALRRADVFLQQIADVRLRTALGGVNRLPPSPALFAELSRLLRDPDVAITSVASVIGRDPAVATKVLQLVNSAFFTSAAPVSDIGRAVARLGLRTLQASVLQVEVEALGRQHAPTVDLHPVWRQAERAAHLARELGGKAPWVADAGTAALLAPVGLLALASLRPDAVASILARERAGEDPYLVEIEEIGVSQYHVSAALLAIWGLPANVVEAVRWCAEPARAAREASRIADTVHAAVALARGHAADETHLRKVGLWTQYASLAGKAPEAPS